MTNYTSNNYIYFTLFFAQSIILVEAMRSISQPDLQSFIHRHKDFNNYKNTTRKIIDAFLHLECSIVNLRFGTHTLTISKIIFLDDFNREAENYIQLQGYF